MIQPIGSGYTSPVYVPQPELSAVQNPTELSSPKTSALKKGIAEYQDSFIEQQKEARAHEKLENDRAKAADVENERNKYIRLTLETDRIEQSKNKFINYYEKLKFVDAAERSEQTKGFHRDQPVEDTAANAALNSVIQANIYSMIRV
jgi:hypothetical protein